MAPLPDLDIQADIADSFAMQRDNPIANGGARPRAARTNGVHRFT
jgi:hypothetical protein